MDPFLRNVAMLMLAEHGAALRDVAVVLPSARSGLHLRKQLAALNGGALWSPETMGWDDLCERLSGLRVVGDIEALFTLRAAEGQEDQHTEDLTAFLDRAPILLADINAIEADLMDVDAFYTDLRKVEGIEQWSFDRPDLSPSQTRMIDRWLKQRDLHRSFKDRLRGERSGTSGMVARAAAEHLANGPALPWKAVWFVGLNALTPAQQKIITSIQRTGHARLCFDCDELYMGGDDHEAGRSLRRTVDLLGEGLIPQGTGLRDLPRTVRSTEVPAPLAECVHAGRLLADLPPDELSRTAVILADESLLLPLLESLPGNIGTLNITMGLRLSKLPVFNLLETFFRLRHACRTSGRIPTDELHELIAHPLLAPALANSAVLGADARKKPIAQRWVPAAALSGKWSVDLQARALLSALMEDVADRGARPPYGIIIGLALAAGHAPFEREQLFRAARLLGQLDRELHRLGAVTDDGAYGRLFARLAREQRIPFVGEPLQGLQIMGMLDTRAVDHDRLIILSCNEGVLPPANADRSFIPFDIRLLHNMALPSDADALQAYTFHRAVQRAQEVHLIRSTAGTNSDVGETRYVRQLKAGLGTSNTRFEHRSYHVPVVPRSTAAITVAKDATVMALLRDRLAKGLSPSALGTFLRCPLDFHFKYVLGLREPEVLSSDIGHDVMGNAVHKTLELLLEKNLGQPLTAAALREAAKRAGTTLRERLLHEAPHVDTDAGHAHLQWDMAREAVERWLLLDAGLIESGASITILSLEQQLSVVVPGAEEALGMPLRLTGRLDRMEERDGTRRIVDMKTGNVDVRDLGIELPGTAEPKDKALQLAAYALMQLISDPSITQLKAGLVALRKPSLQDRTELRINGAFIIERSHLPLLADEFIRLARRIVDDGAPFEHNAKSGYCRFCLARK